MDHTGHVPTTEALAVTGLLLAAGAAGAWGCPRLWSPPTECRGCAGTAEVLLAGGCGEVVVVLGAGEREARAALAGVGTGVEITVCAAWERGMGESLRTGIAALRERSARGALIHLVDLPDVGAAVVRRLLGSASGPGALARAAYDGVPGHPVLLGAHHFAGAAEQAAGDSGARAYLRRHRPVLGRVRGPCRRAARSRSATYRARAPPPRRAIASVMRLPSTPGTGSSRAA
ncbi:nucleotidyltransferase family protein [Georgenia sp. SUBG003]|uniref:nucleotidyltransferase family protein n=1 Tax=Georgenia sp. SUBG003 TaxID=1497974 RepID=UPI003AB3A35D